MAKNNGKAGGKPDLHVADVSDEELHDLERAVLQGNVLIQQKNNITLRKQMAQARIENLRLQMENAKMQIQLLDKELAENLTELKTNAEKRNGFLTSKGFEDPIAQSPQVNGNRLVATKPLPPKKS